jgi:hypothetical protein
VSYLKLKKDGFHITRNLLDRAAFGKWWNAEGRAVHYDMLLRLRARWFFGQRRVRRRLYRAACRVFDPVAPFAITLEHHLDELPVVICRIGLAIRRRRHQDLYTVDETAAVIVIPRGIVRNDYEVRLAKLLSDSPHAAGFPGLARRLVRPLALEAEELLFQGLCKGRDAKDAGEDALLIGVDDAFRWRINGTDGHYYLALSCAGTDLSNRKARKRFRSEAEEVRRAQDLFLKRMDTLQRRAAAEPFRLVRS